ncbi:MAG: hypothetical protein IKS19_04135 [Clostridia bacterium]|nr:hypothetical protein [Clostridia bacterium]
MKAAVLAVSIAIVVLLMLLVSRKLEPRKAEKRSKNAAMHKRNTRKTQVRARVENYTLQENHASPDRARTVYPPVKITIVSGGGWKTGGDSPSGRKDDPAACRKLKRNEKIYFGEDYFNHTDT